MKLTSDHDVNFVFALLFYLVAGATANANAHMAPSTSIISNVSSVWDGARRGIAYAVTGDVMFHAPYDLRKSELIRSTTEARTSPSIHPAGGAGGCSNPVAVNGLYLGAHRDSCLVQRSHRYRHGLFSLSGFSQPYRRNPVQEIYEKSLISTSKKVSCEFSGSHLVRLGWGNQYRTGSVVFTRPLSIYSEPMDRPSNVTCEVDEGIYNDISRVFDQFPGELGLDYKLGPATLPMDRGMELDRPQKRASPLVIDLDGDGVESLGYSRERYFDHDGNGMVESTAWVGSDDGLLVRDLNDNRRIDDGSELFGSNTRLASGALAANGFVALADLDGNSDGVVDASDSAFAVLRIWRDANGNGMTEAGELLTLAQAGISGIRTAWQPSSLVDHNDQAHRQIGSAIRNDGSDAAVEDVWFTVDASRRINRVPGSAAWEMELIDLPDAKAFGNVLDLHQAMASNKVLRQMVQIYSCLQDLGARHSQLEPLIYEWAGVARLDPHSRGRWIDARKMAVVEALVGRAYRNIHTPNDPVPRPEAASLLEGEFGKFEQYVEAQLSAQLDYRDSGIFLGGFASGYNHVMVDWGAVGQTMADFSAAGNSESISQLSRVLNALGAYSPSYRAQLGETFRTLVSQHPEIGDLLSHRQKHGL